MEPPRDQRAYWDGAATTKRFTHPWSEERHGAGLPPGARVLDVGCGQGRLLAELARGGRRAVGVDSSAGMLAEARRRGAPASLLRAHGTALPLADASFDAVVLFAVLTCVPALDDQARLVAECVRVLKPGGALVVSDLWRQDDARNGARYAQGRRRFGLDGVFTLPEGVVLGHLDRARLDVLLEGLALERLDPLEIVTMNGHAARGFQAVARRPGARARVPDAAG